MIRRVTIEGRGYLLIYCDWCKRRIEDGSRAAYVWDATEPPIVAADDDVAPMSGDIWMVHKGACHRAWEQHYPGRRWRWGELYELPVFLGVNIHLDWEQALRHTAMGSAYD
jgi:hypothetical protein